MTGKTHVLSIALLAALGLSAPAFAQVQEQQKAQLEAQDATESAVQANAIAEVIAKTGDVLYKGIAERTFERSFQLADHVVVKGARLENGLLHVDLVREIPEAMKPRAIPIAGSGKVLEVQPTKAAA